MGIAGSVMADKKAKEALSRNNSITQPISGQDIKANVKYKFRNKSKKRYEDIEPDRYKFKTFLTNYRTYSPPEFYLGSKSYIKKLRLEIGYTHLSHIYTFIHLRKKQTIVHRIPHSLAYTQIM